MKDSANKANSSQSLGRKPKSDQLENEILLTASFKYEDNLMDQQKATFLTQVDQRNHNGVQGQGLRFNSKSLQRAQSREKERSTVFGQTERVESKVISYEDKSPTYDLTP